MSEEAREGERAYLRGRIATSLTMLGQWGSYTAAGAAFQWLSPFPPQTTLALVRCSLNRERVHRAFMHTALPAAPSGGLRPLNESSPAPAPASAPCCPRCQVCTLWAGNVCAISFMEAPVKFLAPVAKRWAALDIGRTVFRALNAAELGFSATAGIIVLRAGLLRAGAYPSRLLLAASLILALQTAWLLPALERRAKHAIVAAVGATRAAGLPPAQAAARRALRAEVGEAAPQPRALHAVYDLRV